MTREEALKENRELKTLVQEGSATAEQLARLLLVRGMLVTLSPIRPSLVVVGGRR